MAGNTNTVIPMPEGKRRVLFAYIAVGMAVFTWKLIEFFPSGPLSAGDKVSIFNIDFSGEGRLILIALLAGIVGGFVHVAVSYAQYRATMRLTEEWFSWYLLRPVIGGGLAMAFYAVVRAGFVTPGAGADSAGGAAQILSPYGILAVGLLVGLCNAQAERKLRSVGQALFDTSKGAQDYEAPKAVPAAPATPKVSAIEPQKLAPAIAGTTIVIKGQNFDPAHTEVKLKDTPLKVVSATATELRCEVPVGTPNLAGGQHQLEVKTTGEGGKTADPYTVIVA